jgi:hypothetical protein
LLRNKEDVDARHKAGHDAADWFDGSANLLQTISRQNQQLLRIAGQNLLLILAEQI